jgi:hypothetical protein
MESYSNALPGRTSLKQIYSLYKSLMKEENVVIHDHGEAGPLLTYRLGGHVPQALLLAPPVGYFVPPPSEVPKNYLKYWSTRNYTSK